MRKYDVSDYVRVMGKWWRHLRRHILPLAFWLVSPLIVWSQGGYREPVLIISDVATAVALQPDGKIVAAGVSDKIFALARYNANGSLDASFGTGGKVTTAVGSSSGASALAIQANGKIVVVGSSLNSGNFDFVLNPR